MHFAPLDPHFHAQNVPLGRSRPSNLVIGLPALTASRPSDMVPDAWLLPSISKKFENRVYYESYFTINSHDWSSIQK